MEVLTNGQQRMTNFHCSSFGCHVDISDVAPGVVVRRYRGWGWGLTLDGDVVCRRRQAMVDCCRCWAGIMMVIEERRSGLLLMSKLSIGVC